VLKVRGENVCNRGVEGSGFLYTPDRLMTNAHVVAGVRHPEVLVGGQEVPGTVVYYNPRIDVAVLAVHGTGRRHLRFDLHGHSGQPGAVLGYPQDGPYDVQAARIRGEQNLRSPDIYGNGTVLRHVYSVRALVRPGNSGGPLVSAAGRVLGVVFAASVTSHDTGYALTADQVGRAAVSGRNSHHEVSTGGCA
jgi:S1-C subfamily serine protease